VLAPRDGYVSRLAAREVGEAARWLGAGRLHPDQVIDPGVGVELHVKVGDSVSQGEPMATLHVRDEAMAQRAVQMITEAYVIGETAVEPPPLILETSED
jgi:thymidine phosphorylase